MPSRFRPKRSALYVPSNNSRALAKAPSLSVDVVIYDLEDSILPDQKKLARNDLAQHLAHSAHQCEVVVRINSMTLSAFYDDLAWLESDHDIDAVLLPKVRSADGVTKAAQLLKEVNFNKPIWLLIETVDAILNLNEIVRVADKNSTLVLGAEDLAKEMRINHTPGRLGLLPILTQLILHARSAKLPVLDAVFSNLDNELGFIQSCEQARNLGFDGKTIIHPKQINRVNEIFSPTPQQIERAKKILTAWNDRDSLRGVVLVDGEMIEQLHVEQARELLERVNYDLSPGQY